MAGFMHATGQKNEAIRQQNESLHFTVQDDCQIHDWAKLFALRFLLLKLEMTL